MGPIRAIVFCLFVLQSSQIWRTNGRSVPRRGCRARVDLAFVVDGSGSTEAYGRGNFRRCLNFVKGIVNQFNMRNGETRFAVVLFLSRPRLIFGFRRYRSKGQVLNAIDRIRYPRGGRRTGYAMKYTYSQVFRYARRGVRKVVIVMTDGRSQDSVVGPVRLFRGRNIKCYAVGIGRTFNRRRLLQIAAGDRRHVLTAGFRNLGSIAGTIGRRACRGAGPIRPIRPVRPGRGVYSIPVTADLAFLIDGSGYVGRRNFHLEKAFIKSIARRFTISKYQSHIGVATYGNRPHLRMRFNQYSSLGLVLRALNYIRYPNQAGRRVDLGMRASLRYFFSRRYKFSFGRRILVVVVSGRQTGRSNFILSRLHSQFMRMGVQVYVVVVGRIDYRYLRPITYRNRHVYYVRSYRSLVTRAGQIARAIHDEMRIERERYRDLVKLHGFHVEPRSNSTEEDWGRNANTTMINLSEQRNGTKLENML